MDNTTRRRFLQIAGLSVLGLGARQISHAMSNPAVPQFVPEAKALVGKRWAMVVDYRKCSSAKEGCVDCIKACDEAHNVPEIPNRKNEVKWIWKTDFEHAFPTDAGGGMQQFLTSTTKGNPFIILCNHCDNPPCVRVCPVQATFKRPDGIVMMDYHRCIGCRYCMAACPFGARSLNWRDPRPFIKKENPEYPTRTRGVVEKCTFCYERLAVGKMPACVEACKKEKALVFGDLEDPNSEVSELLRKNPTIRRKPELGTLPQVYYIV